MRVARPRRCRQAIGTFLCLIGAGCFGPGSIPDQSQFEPLASLGTNGEIVVRLYAAPIPNLESIAIHPWFVVKWADETEFDRWEVLQSAGAPYGHVRLNLNSPTSDVGAGGVFVLAELIGPAAESVVAFIETQSPNYSCRDHYISFPGPNSNTYAQWVLDNTGWAVTLPAAAIGKGVQPNCK